MGRGKKELTFSSRLKNVFECFILLQIERGLRGKEVRGEKNEKDRGTCKPQETGIVIQEVISQVGFVLKFTTELCVGCLETIPGVLVTSVIECAGCEMILPLQDLLQPVQFLSLCLVSFFFFLNLISYLFFFLLVIFKSQSRDSVNVCLQPCKHSLSVIEIILKTTGVE